jgi:predicted RNA-binding Zn-ribbon protein involved in translation (DUF1610 family)
MIETSTDWEDSGFDCDHCGGEILKRIDHETGRADQISYQCRECGCQWAIGGDVIRIGEGTYCQAAARARHKQSEPVGLPEIPVDLEQWSGLLSKSLWILLPTFSCATAVPKAGGKVYSNCKPLSLIGPNIDS